jgi:predicted enzyme related to lactoylglutathione lyase
MAFEELGSTYELMPGTVTIDTNDAARLAEWWAGLLGVETVPFGDDYVALRSQKGGRVNLAFQNVPEPKQGKNRVHVDFVVRDLDAVTSRIRESGGDLLAEHTMGPYTWRVAADPDGNEFCIVLLEEDS